jgi:hypothetical protein
MSYMIIDFSMEQESSESQQEDEYRAFKQRDKVFHNGWAWFLLQTHVSYFPIGQPRGEHHWSDTNVHLYNYKSLCVSLTNEIPYSSVLHKRRGNMTGKSTAKMLTTVATNSKALWFVMNWKLTMKLVESPGG